MWKVHKIIVLILNKVYKVEISDFEKCITFIYYLGTFFIKCIFFTLLPFHKNRHEMNALSLWKKRSNKLYKTCK